NTPSHAILPYSELLDLLPGYLQHSLMETNGKSVDLQGSPVTYATAPVIWGSAGTKNQHTYFQWLHQGTHLVPSDFIVVASDTVSAQESVLTFLHFLAQTETLLRGTEKSGASDEQQLPGNKPSTSLLLSDLSPTTLGQLLALYEHIGFVQSVVWNLNPFSHWGIELGKRFSAALGSIDDIAAGHHDSSTLGLLDVFKRMQQEQHQRDPFHTGAVREESVYSVF
ncbi:MAG TPA: hypothetical protein VM553_14470, partial [Dongiaceae bacterium]|nr:hypothetical protein [Dongiaceae bacterium]